MQGCVNERRNHVVAKPVYILELLDPPSQSPGISGIDLEILTVNADGEEEDRDEEEMDRDIHLLVKSPPNLKWSLHSKSIAGLVEIVADADVRTTGVKFSSVALRTEVITVSGRELVDWSKDFIAPVQLYAGIHGANTIKLKIPPTGKNKASPRDRTTSSNGKPEKGPVRKNGPDQQDPSKNQIRTTCAGGQMEVVISKIFIEWAGLGDYKISLTDPTCQPIEESDDSIILRTGLTACGTQAAPMDDVVSFTNAVIIKTPPGLVNSYLEDEVGSGFFREEGGSGLDDLDPLTDDEDYGKKHLNITVECKISIEKPSAKCDMILYKEPLFRTTKTNYPVTVLKDSFMFIKASIGSDSTLMVDSCWFSNSKLPQDSDAHTEMIVTNGCERDPYFTLIDPPMESHNGPNMNEAKFRIIFKDWIKGYSQIYLHCQFYSCQRSSATGCVRGPRKGCTEIVPGDPRPRRPACAPVTIGPLELIDRDIPKQVLVTPQARPDYRKDDSNHGQQQRIIVEGLDSATVVGIAFAAFAIGILLTGALWFIHSHTGPIKRGVSNHRGADASGDLTPNSSSPMTA
ncbi:unnamed protein product [Lymnaea stagnalis]|uniref:ZP domain-containing protein n=1 Tax=Lymnaea stagnalis TaxID=6523 RepID=A0AAV2I4M6_LYMST